MIAFLFSGLGLKIMAGIAIVLFAGGLVLKHDHKIRAAEAELWKPKLTQCATANTALETEYRAFVAKRRAEIATDISRSKAMKAAQSTLLDKLAKHEAAGQAAIDAARAAALAAPLPKDEACAKADRDLRALAADLMRDDAQK